MLDALRVALTSGTSLTLTCACLGPVRLNPAVTVAMVAGSRVSPWRAIPYVGAQVLGTVSGCALLLGTMPAPSQGQLGLNEVASGVHLPQASTVELAVTLPPALGAFTPHQHRWVSCGPALAGVAVTSGHLMMMEFNGCRMNPARSFDPAMLTMNFKDHWVFWAGPCTGALLAWLLHDLVLRPRWSCPFDWLTEFKRLFFKDLPTQSGEPEHTGE